MSTEKFPYPIVGISHNILPWMLLMLDLLYQNKAQWLPPPFIRQKKENEKKHTLYGLPYSTMFPFSFIQLFSFSVCFNIFFHLINDSRYQIECNTFFKRVLKCAANCAAFVKPKSEKKEKRTELYWWNGCDLVKSSTCESFTWSNVWEMKNQDLPLQHEFKVYINCFT